jgi:hypothetical protein
VLTPEICLSCLFVFCRYVRWSIHIANLAPNVADGLKQLEAIVPNLTGPEQDEQALLLLDLEISRRLLSMKTDPDVRNRKT